MNHRAHARTLRNAAGELLRQDANHPDYNALNRIAATLSHHRLILVPDVARPPAYFCVHTDADNNWQSLTMHADKADAAKQRATMRRHWRKLRREGVDV